MNLKRLTPKQSLNKAYLKEKISRSDIEHFKSHFTALIEKINDKGDEEHLKSLIADFLKLTYYNQSQNQINPIGKNDLVIHTGKSPADPYGVILEVKSPPNKGEMISEGKANVKAFHELVLYYLDERIDRNHNELKQLIVTNIYDWYVIDANEFDKKIYRNTAIKKLYDLKKSDNKDNPWFYDELRKLFDNHAELSIDATFFDLRDFKKIIANKNRQDDKGLISLYKILSPVHLLKLPFANDSNTLQPKFYSELLHLIGLYEYKEGSKKLISRKKEGERNPGSLLENAIVQLDSHDKITRLEKASQYGDNNDDRTYNAALELVITWINRILFLKLLEAQLVNYHKGNLDYTFLDKEKIKDFDDLDKLFFRVLAKRQGERPEDIQKLFGKVPYLNSSLFEPTELEHQTLFINGLEDFVKLPIISSTVLKDANGKTLKGSLDALDYLFAFLNAYDFSSEGAEEIQEDNKQLINASVLGLIFEKINGYKDGSFFTPGFITMYMCRETIRRAFVQKINERIVSSGHQHFKPLETITDVYNQIGERLSKNSVNEVLNNLKICDPAVGSGHFLVSALNEMIAIKCDLQILQYRKQGQDTPDRTMRDYSIVVENDELIITDDNGDIFEYNPKNPESQRVQETLFHEKQTIIENCLFGVDINPNSVKICRLRLWIELLKNAYYKPDGELETLPNIDINIKLGNSLISRFALDADLKQALRGANWNINDYRIAVGAYKNATNKEAKHELVKLIDRIKNEFKKAIGSKQILDLKKLESDFYTEYERTRLFEVELDKEKKSKIESRKKAALIKIAKQKNEIDEIKNNKIFENAFEWRFEFPEVLNDDGDFIGFDIVIGNPPYGASFKENEKIYIRFNYQIYQYKFDSYTYFIELGLKLLNNKYFMAFITPTLWLSLENNYLLRKMVISSNDLLNIKIFGENVFDEAVVNTCSFLLQKSTAKSDLEISNKGYIYIIPKVETIASKGLVINYRINQKEKEIIEKIHRQSIFLHGIGEVIQGITAYDSYSGQDKEIIKDRVYHSSTKKDSTYGKWLDGKDVSRYSISWANEWLTYGPWLAAPRERRFFEGKRILFREVPGKGKRIQAAITEDEYFYGHSISPFKPNKEFVNHLEYILGIVNSSLISWYGKLVLPNFGKDVFPKLNPADIKELPIPSGFNYLDEITNKVLGIMSQKTAESHMENQIDQLVYQLYGLTEEEIKIVEAK